MSPSLGTLQQLVQGLEGFNALSDYEAVAQQFLEVMASSKPTRIIAPNCPNYVFFQYGPENGHRITRPLNTDLFVENPRKFATLLGQFHTVIDVLGSTKGNRAAALKTRKLTPTTVDAALYTIQQCLGSVADSLPESNQARKRAGQLFEGLVKLIIGGVGVACDGRVVKLPIPGHDPHTMSYELDMVISRDTAIVTSESKLLMPSDIVGSIKTTSKDRIDKIFLDKFLMSRLLGRDVKVVAIFLHDVQRAKGKNSRFCINSTFKSNHFLGYSIALNPLDGVYYVDPRPAMATDPELAKQISSFGAFLVRDLWQL